MASGSALKTSGLTTLPSCMGAMVKPVGVRRMAMFWPCALRVQRLQRLLVAGAELLVDGAAADLVVLALEPRRQDAAQLVERRHHALGERLAAAVRELQRLGAVGVFEIVDVDPVGGRRRLGGLGSEVGLDGGGLARGRRAQHEHVEVVALDVGAELDGLQRPVLADQPGDRDAARPWS